MAFTSARNILDIKEKTHFKHENTRINKYTLADKLPQQLSELTIRPAYSIRRITNSDREKVLDFLGRFFFRDEPLNIAVNLLDGPEDRCYELEEYVSASLPDGVSVAAVDDDDEFVGVVVNGIARREEFSTEDKSVSCPNPKFQRILKVLGHLEREARIWDKLPPSCHTALEVRIVSTHSEWRGKGLMKALCEESERIAREIGADALRMDTTSAFSAAAAERLKYKKIYEVPYADLPYAPLPEPPHYDAKVYIKEI
ncbi:arylalkylamine N-acetyltransferase 1 [Aricia agestis]|uniref:arylalkylamine N-acetyltransferase 1 n=1 Tax=Aricia agestis TaxID=91739 RepID=UPI001C20A494|nr:arylalkylamine N-acetyltransferase 1 [Aricia agestis]